MPVTNLGLGGKTAEKSQPASKRRVATVEQVESSHGQGPGPDGQPMPLEGLLGSDYSQSTFERHAALLGDPRMSHPMYSSQRTAIARQLQRDYGNRYVQRLVERIQRDRSEAAQTKLTVGPAHQEMDSDGLDLQREYAPDVQRAGELEAIKLSGELMREAPKTDLETQELTGASVRMTNEAIKLVANLRNPQDAFTEPLKNSRYYIQQMLDNAKESEDLMAELTKAELGPKTDSAARGITNNRKKLDALISKSANEIYRFCYVLVSDLDVGSTSLSRTAIAELVVSYANELRKEVDETKLDLPKSTKGTQTLEKATVTQKVMGYAASASTAGAKFAVLAQSAGALDAASKSAVSGSVMEGLSGLVDIVTGLKTIASDTKDQDQKMEAGTLVAEGAAKIVRGTSSAIFFIEQTKALAKGMTEKQSLQAAGSTVAAQILGPATIALGAVDILRGSYGAYKASERQNALKSIEKSAKSRDNTEAVQSAKVAGDTQQEKKTEGKVTAVKGAVTLVAGTILTAAGITNPIGWMVLAGAGLIGAGAFIMKRVAQVKQGKKLVEQKVKEHEVALKAWKDAGGNGDGPKLEARYDPKKITKFSWRSYGDVFREEMIEQRRVVAQKLYEKGVASPSGKFPEMEQIVTTLGLVIDKDKQTPTAAQIYKSLKT